MDSPRTKQNVEEEKSNKFCRYSGMRRGNSNTKSQMCVERKQNIRRKKRNEENSPTPVQIASSLPLFSPFYMVLPCCKKKDRSPAQICRPASSFFFCPPEPARANANTTLLAKNNRGRGQPGVRPRTKNKAINQERIKHSYQTRSQHPNVLLCPGKSRKKNQMKKSRINIVRI